MSDWANGLHIFISFCHKLEDQSLISYMKHLHRRPTRREDQKGSVFRLQIEWKTTEPFDGLEDFRRSSSPTANVGHRPPAVFSCGFGQCSRLPSVLVVLNGPSSPSLSIYIVINVCCPLSTLGSF